MLRTVAQGSLRFGKWLITVAGIRPDTRLELRSENMPDSLVQNCVFGGI